MIVSVYKVDTSGNVELAVANLPYSSLQWNRKMSDCGQFEIKLTGTQLPFDWPGRYLIEVQGEADVGVIEKVSTSGGADAVPSIAGRFAISFWDNWCPGNGGATVSGANYKQALTQAITNWHMDDIPAIALGSGTASKTGESYEMTIDVSDTGMDAILDVNSANGCYVAVGYDRSKPSQLQVSINEGVNRTRDQSTNPVQVFALSMGNVSDITYSGDYSPAATEVLAHAESTKATATVSTASVDDGTVTQADDTTDDTTTIVDCTVAVPGRDLSIQWARRTYEDVSSLIGKDTEPTVDMVKAKGTLRAYNHLPEITVDADVFGEGYKVNWDLCDLCEVEVPALSVVAQERIEEVRIVDEGNGVTTTAVLGTKTINHIVRSMMGRR